MAEKEYIELEKAKQVIYDYILEQTVSKYPSAELCKASRMGAEGAMYELDYVPTADVVEVVRCSECEYGKKATINDKGFKICPASGMEITDNDYCSYGERRTDNEQV